MFRITPYITTIRNCSYYRRHIIELKPYVYQQRCVSISPSHKYKKTSDSERAPCPKPVPPCPPPKNDAYFWGTMFLVFLAGGFAVYAKRSPEIRDWLTIHAPWFDDFIAVMYEENMSYKDFAQKCAVDFKDYIINYFEDKPKPCSIDGTFTSQPIEVKFENIVCDPDAEDEEETEDTCDIVPPPVVTKDICEIERCLKDLGETAINNYMTAKDACAYYNALVQETMMYFSIKKLKELRGAMSERLDLVKDSLSNATEANAKLDELTRYFDCGVQAPKEAIASTKGMLKEYQDKIKSKRMEYQWENDKSLVMDVQWQKVEEIIDKYTDEAKTMFPGLNHEAARSIFRGDGDLLLIHLSRYILKLKAELAEAAEGMSERVERGVDTLPHGPKEDKARNALIQSEAKKKRAQAEAEYKKRFNDQTAENDNKLKEALKKQLLKHEETLRERLLQREVEVKAKFDKMVAEKVAAEKLLFEKQLRQMALKLKLVEDKLNARLKVESETRRSQELWTAGASLLAATKKGDPVIKVDKELNAIEKASGDGDKLVLTVLKAIPKSVRDKGLVPESVLRERYHSMEKVAMKVALVEQEGGPLPVYFLSWLQAAFLFMKLSGIPQKDIDKPLTEPVEDLDTFDLLQRSRYWMEHGNLSAAVRYVGSLEGASRAAAAAWLEAAKALLDTRLAAEAVVAHAVALGLQYL